MRFGGAISILLLILFIYFGYSAGWWQVMNNWDFATWAIYFLSCAFFWNLRNEFPDHK